MSIVSILTKTLTALHRLHQTGIWEWDARVPPPTPLPHPTSLLLDQVHTKVMLRMAELIKERFDCRSCVYQMLYEEDQSRLGAPDYREIENCLGRRLKPPENGKSGDYLFHHRFDLFVVVNEDRKIDPYSFQRSASQSIVQINAALARLAQPIPGLSLALPLYFKSYRPKGPPCAFELHYELIFSGVILDPNLSEVQAELLRRDMAVKNHDALKVPDYKGGWLNLRDL